MVGRTSPGKCTTGVFYVRGLTGISSVYEEKNNRAKFCSVYRSVRLRVKPTAVQNNLSFRILPASMLCMRRLELRFSDEVASAAVLDHVAKSVACIGIGVMAGHPKGVLGQFLRSRSVYIRRAGQKATTSIFMRSLDRVAGQQASIPSRGRKASCGLRPSMLASTSIAVPLRPHPFPNTLRMACTAGS